MSKIFDSQQNNINIAPNPDQSGAVVDAQKPDHNIQAHYSNNMKVTRTKRSVNNTPANLPIHHLITPKEMNLRLQSIDTDIYEGTKKEKSKHEFNSKLYFEIFGCVALSAAIIACIRKFKK